MRDKIIELADKGFTEEEIAETLGLFSDDCIYNVLGEKMPNNCNEYICEKCCLNKIKEMVEEQIKE